MLKTFGDQIEHVLLGLAQLENAFTLLIILVILGIIVIDNALGFHIARKISILTAKTGDNHNSLIGEGLGIGNQRI